MNLPVPVVGQEPGPQYAQDVNASLNIVDGHNHTPGYGVPIPAAAINYNADISAMDNRLTLAKSVTFTEQGSPLAGILPDLAALYVSGVDLYYNDGSGNQIRVTQGGSVTGTPGSITGLTPPASASYSIAGSEFIWQSDVNTSAGMDNGPVTIREEIANAHGITIQSPSALAADYSFTFPSALPGSTSFVTSDTSGNLDYVSTTGGIIQSMLQPRPTGTSVGTGGVAISNASAGFNSTSSSYAFVLDPGTNPLLATIITTGRPVSVSLQANPSTIASIALSQTGTNTNPATITGQVAFYRNSVIQHEQSFSISTNVAGTNELNSMSLPATSFHFLDVVTAGTQLYEVAILVTGTSTVNNITANNIVIVAYEI